MSGICVYYAVSNKVVSVTSDEIAIKDLKALVDDANIIVRGTVSDIHPSFWSNPNGERGQNARNIIQTDIIVDVEDVYKNESFNDETVTVRIDKGKVGSIVSESKGYPDFDLKEEVILFLSKDDGDLANPTENYYVLTGMSQGKFSKDNENSYSNRIGDNKRDLLNLITVKDEISEIMEDLKKKPKVKMPEDS